MSKELDALECIVVDLTPIAKEHNKEEIEQLKKSLEALEIIKEHKLLNYVLKNEKCANMYQLSKEKCDLLKEVLR